VHREITPIFDSRKVVLQQSQRSITPFGGISVFFEYLGKLGYAQKIAEHMPFQLKSPNAIDPARTFTAFIVSVLVGARRFAHTGLFRIDKTLHTLMGIVRFPNDDTIRNLFKRFTEAHVYSFYDPLWRWMLERVPQRSEGYTLDLDSTVFERYGKQQGALKGYNPKKRGRPSHHPLLAVLAEAHFVLHGWLRSGNCASARGAVEFLKEVVALLGDRHRIRLVRSDSGFFEDKLLSFLESVHWPYIVVARLTYSVKKELQHIDNWRELDPNYAVGEFRKKLFGWAAERRFVVVRERLRDKSSPGRKLFDIPDYTFRVLVTSRSDEPEEIWREYNQRGDVENRIAELKHDLGADDFCMHEFFPTEAVFRAILLLFNLLSDFQRVIGLTNYRRPATLRVTVFLCGAILGRAGHQQVVHMSADGGGLKRRILFFEKILSNVFPTSPKLASEPI